MKQSVAAAFISFISLVSLGLPFELFGAPPLNVKTTNAKAVSTAPFQARGEYLARAGNCRGCHTAQG
ncbi:MAG TPA: cytochrome c, partial [Nitrosospira sp.]